MNSADPLPDSLYRVVAQFATRAAQELRAPVETGAIPEVGAFDLRQQHVGIALDSLALSGLDSLEPVRLDWHEDAGAIRATLTVATTTAALRGTYRVAATPVSRAALLTASSLTGELAASAAGDTDLARWFRDQELRRSENGKVLNGMYAAHEDTINDLMVAGTPKSKALRQAMRAPDTKKTTQNVRASTSAHRGRALLRAQGGAAAVEGLGAAPPVGETTDYSAGFNVHAYLIAAAKEAAGPRRDDPTNDYARLLNSTAYFNCAVTWVRKTYPGPHTLQEILQIIADTPPEKIPCGPKFAGPADATAGASAAADDDAVPRWPLDREYFLQVYEARTEQRKLLKDAPTGAGACGDDEVRLELDLHLELRDGAVTVADLVPRVTLLRLRLAAPGGDDLLTRLDQFIGETAFYIDLVRSRVAGALRSDEFRQKLTTTVQ